MGISEQEKEIFKAAAERRRANGIKLGRWSVNLDKAALVSIENFWNGWCETLGKERATDYLVVAMRKADEALRRAIAQKSAQTRQGGD